MLQSLEIVFVGTGVSTAIPVLGHFGNCACRDAIETPHSKNKRNNVSILLAATFQPHPPLFHKLQQMAEGSKKNKANVSHDNPAPNTVNVLIDCGKTFRQAYFETLVKRHIQRIDALLLTHDHADAVAGLDDIRDLQDWSEQGLVYRCDYFIPTYLMSETLSVLQQQVGYIVRNSRQFGEAPKDFQTAMRVEEEVVSKLPPSSNIIQRRSTALHLWTVPSHEPHPFCVTPLGDQVPFFSLPVEHGEGYMCLGFVFGTGARLTSHPRLLEGGMRAPATPVDPQVGECMAYLSDVSHIPANAMAFLKQLERLDYLVIDLLLRCEEKHFSHFTWTDMWIAVRELNPKKVLCVGMWCDVEHGAGMRDLATQLAEEHAKGRCMGVESVELAFDGLSLHLGCAQSSSSKVSLSCCAES